MVSERITRSHILWWLDGGQNHPQYYKLLIYRWYMADRQGFEPWVGLHPQRFSRPPRSTTPAPVLSYGLLMAFFRPLN